MSVTWASLRHRAYAKPSDFAIVAYTEEGDAAAVAMRKPGQRINPGHTHAWPEKLPVVLALWQQRFTRKEIAYHTGLHYTTVCRWIRERRNFRHE